MTIRPLPFSWFERPQYGPRIEAEGRAGWYLLDDSFRPFADRAALGALVPRNTTAPKAVAAAFRETRARWELPASPETDASLRALESSAAAAIVAGQQPGFLGGPLYTLYKALSAIALARCYAAASGRPCVPVFWVAADDHDLEEVRCARLPAGAAGETVFALPHEADRRPVADYAIDAATERVIDEAKRFLARRRHGELAAELLDLYAGGGVASGFARLLTSLLGAEGLLVIDPATLRRHAAPLLRRVLEDAGGVLAAIAAGRRHVQERGLRPFVAERYPLFLIDAGQRHYLEPSADGFRWGDRPPVPTGELIALLAQAPECFSPGALLRPLVQQAVLPSVLTAAGPAEVGYHAQIAPLAEFLSVPVPRVALRLQATLVDGRDARVLEGVSSERLAAARTPGDLLAPGAEAASLAALESRAGAVAATLEEAVATLPQSPRRDRLARRAQRLHEEIARLGEQIASERRSLREDESARAAALWETLFPGGELQERRWSFLYHLAKHGREWITELLAEVAADPLSLAHRLVVFERPD